MLLEEAALVFEDDLELVTLEEFLEVPVVLDLFIELLAAGTAADCVTALLTLMLGLNGGQ